MSCKYRGGGIVCSMGYLDNCETCGWNPAVEAERKKNLRSGKIKSYLRICPDTINAAQTKLYRDVAYKKEKEEREARK